MKTLKCLFYAVAAVSIMLSCGGSGSEETVKAAAPVLQSTVPADGAVDVALNTSEIVLTYDQNIKVLTADLSKITLDGGASVTKVNAYSKTLTLSISGLSYGTKYTLGIPAGVVSGYKENQESTVAVNLSFSTVKEPEDPGTDERLSDVAWNLAAKLRLGWNMGNQMDATSGNMPSETAWGNPKCTQETFTNLKKAGFTSVRIPITWLEKIGAAPDYKIDEEWMTRVAEIVGYAETAGLYTIINTHHDECNNDGRWLDLLKASRDAEFNATTKAKIKAVWTQIANRFKDKGDWLIMESFNELQDGGWGWSKDFLANPKLQCNILNEWNQVFVDAVRATGGNNATRWLGVPSYAANPNFTDYMVLPTDSAGKIMVAVHFYDPSDYTIGDAQYSDWGHTGVAGKKASGSDEDHVQSTFRKLMRNYVNKGIPVYLGEYGCSMRNSSDARSWAFYKYYLEYVVKAAKTYGMPAFLWDNGASGYGKERHGYINHGTGDYMGSSKEVVDIMVNAMNNESGSYTLETVYNKAPKF